MTIELLDMVVVKHDAGFEKAQVCGFIGRGGNNPKISLHNLEQDVYFDVMPHQVVSVEKSDVLCGECLYPISTCNCKDKW